MKWHSRLRSSLFLLTLLSAQPAAQAQQAEPPKGFTQLASVEGITEYLLEDNGLHILLFPDQSKPTITVNVTYLVGSRHEGYGETGMAHLLEHMVFKGTPNHPNIPQELTEHGARPNGSTWYDRTNYFETFSATDENLRWALDMEADRMVNSYIAAKDLESEMTVVRNEFEMGENSPSGVLMERVLSTAYLWHNYGKSTIGARADLENVPIVHLQAFYHKYYQPDNAYLVVAGKFDPMKTLGLIKETFGRLQKPERELIPTYTREPVQDGERFAELRRVGDVQVVSAAYHICPGSHSDYPAVDVLVELLTNEPSGRLYKALVESGKASSQWGYAASLREPGFAYFSADVLKDKSLADAEATMMATIDELIQNPPSSEEVERARKRLLKETELAFRSSDRVGLAMSEFLAQGDWRLGFIYRDRLEQVTPEQVAAAAKRYFKPSNRTVGRFLPDATPDRADIPDVPDIAAMVDGYKGKEAISEGEAFDPSYDNIENRTQRGEVKGTLEYALLAKETRGDAVTARLSLRFGTEQSLKGKQMAARFAGMMLDKGTAKHNRQQLEDKLDELKARVRVGGGASGAYATIEAEHDKLPEVINLLGEMLQQPSFPEEEFNKLKAEELASIEEQRSEPNAIAFMELQRRMAPYDKDDPRYTMTFDEEVAAINALTLDDVKAFYKEFYGATEATLAVVGDFDTKAVETALAGNFKDWKSPSRYERIKDEFYQPKAENVEVETPDKANALFLAEQPFKLNQDNPDYAALLMGNYMLGGGFLNSRLAVRIRQKEGLSYGVGSSFSADARDETATWRAFALYAPENAEALEKAFLEEIEKVRAEGFTAEEVAAAKSGWVQSQQVNRAQDRSLAGTLNSYLDLDRTLEWDAALEAKVMALTPEQINAAMAKYLDPQKMVLVKAGDFAKSRQAKP
ncbi:MAG: insulinase family protein [Lewinellaceae bacterium]|nr:insulinase family protein [Lewinellaceae bacterium]